MATPVDSSEFLALPDELHAAIASSLSVKELLRLRATCKKLRGIFSWKEIARNPIAQLSQYVGKSCALSDRAIVAIQTSTYDTSELAFYHIVKYVSCLGSNPSHGDFFHVLTVLNPEEKLEPYQKGPCICEVD